MKSLFTAGLQSLQVVVPTKPRLKLTDAVVISKDQSKNFSVVLQANKLSFVPDMTLAVKIDVDSSVYVSFSLCVI